ncbi:histidine phosphatase family protein [Bacillus sp. OAE603]|uniref:histidine phosphatase family protein n=1 Tax=Gottfriedia sp. OAE603 TaxID=2663872 RepID=UPI00178C0B93
MEISLVRHGKSIWTENKAITSKEFKDWVLKYDLTGVFEEEIYPTETIKKITTAKVIITSDLERSIKSAEFLKPNCVTYLDQLFRETEVPFPNINFLGLKLKPRVWAVILRCIWLVGYSRECESLSAAKIRAERASKILIKFAQEHNNIVLIGHGFFNILIAKELQKIGWKSNKKPSSKHWQSNTYSMNN